VAGLRVQAVRQSHLASPERQLGLVDHCLRPWLAR
jgi:hypothetical protein